MKFYQFYYREKPLHPPIWQMNLKCPGAPSTEILKHCVMPDILAGLRSLDNVHGTNQYEQLMGKLSADSSDFVAGNQSIFIDLSSWDKSSLSPKIAVIHSAIDLNRMIMFLYCSPHSEQKRAVEPYYLIFR